MKATHNINAYILEKDGKIVQGSDCDGETGAGIKLLQMLQGYGVKNVYVVVTRWYGGVKLGPSRFRVINNTAAIVLRDNGYIQ
ncbi:hypothetical protein HDV06_005030 [Boothiomyces sp. JEL0866]|nr:hypothetical protein HDV06_005030 [Boothiomyces sp. JEL0866]